jgi:hypothetical protein
MDESFSLWLAGQPESQWRNAAGSSVSPIRQDHVFTTIPRSAKLC